MQDVVVELLQTVLEVLVQAVNAGRIEGTPHLQSNPTDGVVSGRMVPQGYPAHLWSPHPSVPPGISGRRQGGSGRQIPPAHGGGGMTSWAQDRRLELVFEKTLHVLATDENR